MRDKMKKLMFGLFLTLLSNVALSETRPWVLDYMNDVKNTQHSGLIFKIGQIDIVVGEQYRLSDIIRPFAEWPEIKRDVVISSEEAEPYSGPLHHVHVFTPQCDMTHLYMFDGQITEQELARGDIAGDKIIIWEGNFEQPRWIRFNDKCDNNPLGTYLLIDERPSKTMDGIELKDVIRFNFIGSD
jgi:hypothetical protein